MPRSTMGATRFLFGGRDFAHQREKVAFRVVEMAHPQLVRRHASDEMRFIFKFYSRRFQSLKSGVNVPDMKIQDRSGMIELGFLRRAEHQAHAAASKKA